MPLGGELGDVTNKLSALNVVDGADASKLQACAPQWQLRAWLAGQYLRPVTGPHTCTLRGIPQGKGMWWAGAGLEGGRVS